MTHRQIIERLDEIDETINSLAAERESCKKTYNQAAVVGLELKDTNKRISNICKEIIDLEIEAEKLIKLW